MKHTRQARRALTNRSLNRQNPSRTPHELWNFVSGLPLDSILQEPVPQMSSSSVQAAWTKWAILDIIKIYITLHNLSQLPNMQMTH